MAGRICEVRHLAQNETGTKRRVVIDDEDEIDKDDRHVFCDGEVEGRLGRRTDS